MSGGSTRGVADLLTMLRSSVCTTDVPGSSCEDVVVICQEVVRDLMVKIVSDSAASSAALKRPLPSEGIEDLRETKKQRRVATGMAALLQQLRADDTPETDFEQPTVSNEKAAEIRAGAVATVDMSKLNRKERRALQQKEREQAGEKSESLTIEEDAQTQAMPAKFEVPFGLWDIEPKLMHCESSVFSNVPNASFGFGRNMVNNYVKLAKFSPCGSFLASTSQDRKTRIFKLDDQQFDLSLLSEVSLGDAPYDCVWHPCGDLIATSSKFHPIHLWDTQGVRQASYRGINHLDELSAAQTMCFSRDGLKLYAGYDTYIRIFDVRKPGRQIRDIKTWKTKPELTGQKGVVSCIAMNPVHDGVYAVGMFNSTIGLYSDRTNFVECLFTGDFSATTDLKYSSDGIRLFSSGRKDNKITCWDMRYPGKVLFSLNRPFEANHRVQFDMDSCDRFLFSGTSTGKIVAFDLKEETTVRAPNHELSSSTSAVPCVSVHPRFPLVAACSGERVFPFPIIDNDSSSDEEASHVDSYTDIVDQSKLQNCIKIWHY